MWEPHWSGGSVGLRFGDGSLTVEVEIVLQIAMRD
jgi:hypothetical protein